MPYTPAYQGAADSNYYGGLSQSTQNMNNLYGFAGQQFGNLYNNTTNNPFNAQALTGAESTAAAGTAAGNQMLGMGNAFAGMVPQALQQGQAGYNASMGYIPQAMGQTNSNYDTVKGYMPSLIDPAIANSQTAQSYIPAVMQTGFDPQSSLYNYNLAQTTDAAKAGSAAAGLAGSPFGAGAAADAAEKFNLDWANNQQARQGAAVGQLGSLIGDSNSSLSTGAGNLTSLSSLLQSITNGGVSNLTSLLSQAGASATSGMNNANTANSASVADTTKGLNTLGESSQLPSQVYNEQQGRSMAALQALVTALTGINGQQGNNTSLWGNYLGIGQNSTQIADNATQINNQSSLMGGLGSLLGSLGQLGGMSTGGGGTLAGDLFFA